MEISFIIELKSQHLDETWNKQRKKKGKPIKCCKCEQALTGYEHVWRAEGWLAVVSHGLRSFAEGEAEGEAKGETKGEAKEELAVIQQGLSMARWD